MALGWHVLAEFKSCSKVIIDSVVEVEKHLNIAAELAGATIVKSVFHQFSPQGVSGVVVIEESHFAIHTWPENAYAAVDLFTCSKDMYFEKALDYLKTKFESEDCEWKMIERGVGISPEKNYLSK